MNEAVGTLSWISGSVVTARLEGRLSMLEQVWVGRERLTAEVIALSPEEATCQVYEETAGLRIGEPIYGAGQALSVWLGPGLLGQTFDGIQRPLDALQERSGIFIRRGGETVNPLDPERQWHFIPRLEAGEEVEPGQILGVVPETPLIEHRVLVPPGIRGELKEVAAEDDYTIEPEIARVVDEQGQVRALTLAQRWPVRRPRPVKERLRPSVPLITGQRVIDTFFPVAKGGSAAVPGPFGSGKTVLQHSLAKWSDADIIIYVGCGERGNEMAEVLEEFPELEDPWSGHPLMERTILIANTSNMPVAAREASINTGVTIAEYYRDQGYDVALMADSTSRWAEALREISGRLEEMPAEEGFPAYLPSRLAAFYERAGRMKTLSGEEGSVTIIGAVSPPGGDFSEPVTRHTQRFTQSWWALTRELTHARHYPAVSWLNSYSLVLDRLAEWWNEQVDLDWPALRLRGMEILGEESNLQQLMELVGPDALTARQQWTLDIARLLREGFLQQNAFHPVDAYAVPKKQAFLLRLIIRVHQQGQKLLEQEAPLADIRQAVDIPGLIRLKNNVPNDKPEQIEHKEEEVQEKLKDLQPHEEE